MSTLFFPEAQDDADVVPNYSYLKVHEDFFSVDEKTLLQTRVDNNLSPSMGPTSSRCSEHTDGALLDNALFTAVVHAAPLPVDAFEDELDVRHDAPSSTAAEARTRTEAAAPIHGRSTRCYCYRRTSALDGRSGVMRCCCRRVQTPPPLFVALRMGVQSPRYLGTCYYKPLVLAPLQLQ